MGIVIGCRTVGGKQVFRGRLGNGLKGYKDRKLGILET
jgi:hypothetical protein